MSAKADYQEYLKSEHWDKLRTAVLDRDGNKCTRCPSTFRLQAHHLFYRAAWTDSLPSDLITLCRDCHEKEHGTKFDQPPPKKPEPINSPITLADFHALEGNPWIFHRKKRRKIVRFIAENYPEFKFRLRRIRKLLNHGPAYRKPPQKKKKRHRAINKHDASRRSRWIKYLQQPKSGFKDGIFYGSRPL